MSIPDPSVVGIDLWGGTSNSPGETQYATFLRGKLRIATRRYMEALERVEEIIAAYRDLPEDRRRHRDSLVNNQLGETDPRTALALVQEQVAARAIAVYSSAYQVEMSRIRLCLDAGLDPNEYPQ